MRKILGLFMLFCLMTSVGLVAGDSIIDSIKLSLRAFGVLIGFIIFFILGTYGLFLLIFSAEEEKEMWNDE